MADLTTEFAVTVMLDLERTHRELLGVVMEETPRLDGFDKMQELIAALITMSAEYLQAHRDEIRADLDLSTTAWIVIQTALRVSFQYVLQSNPPIPEDLFTAALVDMLARYCLP